MRTLTLNKEASVKFVSQVEHAHIQHKNAAIDPKTVAFLEHKFHISL
jgi:hypothetical protein